MAEGKIEEIGKIRLDLTHYPGEDLYCDGDVEDELLKIARDYAEVEYQRIIEERRSWPVLYHLSGLRENIVEWLPIGSNDKVLEIGAGCGAITGALSRKAGEVTCIDLSGKRSRINGPYGYAVDWAVEKGVTNGTSDTAFSPDKVCSRGEIVTFLYRAYN